LKNEVCFIRTMALPCTKDRRVLTRTLLWHNKSFRKYVFLFRYKQKCKWRFRSSGMLCSADR
jgi:hypothetical protein